MWRKIDLFFVGNEADGRITGGVWVLLFGDVAVLVCVSGDGIDVRCRLVWVLYAGGWSMRSGTDGYLSSPSSSSRLSAFTWNADDGLIQFKWVMSRQG